LQYLFFNSKLTCKIANEINGKWGKDKSFFNPSVSFSSRQLAPYTISGSFSGDLSLNVGRDISESNKLGY